MAKVLAAVLAIVLAPLDAHTDKQPQAAVMLSLATYSSDPASIGPDASSRTRIDAIWISMQALQLHPVASCKGSGGQMVIEGPMTAELVRRRFTGVPENATIARAATAHSSSRGVHFVLVSRITSTPRLRARDFEGFAVVAGSARWILAADLARWMAGIDLGPAELTTDNGKREIRIDDQTNADLLEMFRSNLDAGLGLFADLDGDSALGSDERAHPLATGR